jgi:hypothetical protein
MVLGVGIKSSLSRYNLLIQFSGQVVQVVVVGQYVVYLSQACRLIVARLHHVLLACVNASSIASLHTAETPVFRYGDEICRDRKRGIELSDV